MKETVLQEEEEEAAIISIQELMANTETKAIILPINVDQITLFQEGYAGREDQRRGRINQHSAMGFEGGEWERTDKEGSL